MPVSKAAADVPTKCFPLAGYSGLSLRRTKIDITSLHPKPGMLFDFVSSQPLVAIQSARTVRRLSMPWGLLRTKTV
jgi:hypothetical protein